MEWYKIIGFLLKWSTVCGLSLDLFGALIIGSLLLISEERANELSRTVYNGNPAVVFEYLRQSKRAKVGIVIIVIGFIFQIIGSWPKC